MSRRTAAGPHLRSRIRQVVLHGRVRQPEPVGGCLLRPGVEDRGNDHGLSVRGAPGRSAVSHASRLAAAKDPAGARGRPHGDVQAARHPLGMIGP